jgi:hypothetical protein
MAQEPRHRQSLLLALLALLLVAYLPLRQVQDNDFVNYDDYRYVLDNKSVRAGLTPAGVLWAFSNLEAGFWHPLTWLSHMLDCELFGIHPQGHHFSSLLLHIANCMLLFLFLERVTKALWRSALVAVLFAIHPFHVESVAWVSQRKDLLSTLFWNLALLAYAAYVEAPSKTRFALTFLLFCLGLMAKPMVVTLPMILLLLDYWPLRRLQRKKFHSLKALFMEKSPFLVLSIAFAVITFLAEGSIGALPGFESYPAHTRIFGAIVSLATYPLKMIWPADLSVIYLHPGSFAPWKVAFGLLFTLCISFAVVQQSRRRPYLLVGWLWYLITLLPVIGLVQIGSHAYADRYTYVPLTGLFLMIVWSLPQSLSATRVRGVFLGLILCGVLVSLGLTSWCQVGAWKNSLTLFRRALEVNPHNFLAHNNLGFTLAQRGRFEEAVHHYQAAVELNPNFPDAFFNLANALEIMGRTEEAISCYRRVLGLNPSLAGTHRRLGRLLLQKGRREEALFHLSEAACIDPSDIETLQQVESLRKNLSQP